MDDASIQAIQSVIADFGRRLDLVENQRINQQQILPSAVKQRHIEGLVVFTGKAVDRPSNGSTEKQIYFATDTSTLSLWNGLAWISQTLPVSSGSIAPQIVQNVLASNPTTSSGTYADLMTQSITTTQTCNIAISLATPLTINSGANINLSKILRGSTSLIDEIYMITTTAQAWFFYTQYDLAVAAGTYTYHWQWRASAGTGTIFTPAFTLTAFPTS